MEEAFNHFKEYTTNEEPHGYWIDGKVIYRRTINVGSMPNSETKRVAHGITGIDKIVKIEGIAMNSSGASLPLPMSFDGGNVSANIRFSADKTDFIIGCQGNMSTYSGYGTLYYTKTEAE